MIKGLYKKFILSGAERSIKAKKNILLLTILRAISALSGFLIVPLTINYVSSSKYGIWLTINSIVGWFGILDLGLSNGFRNKFTECLAKKDYESGKGYLSSTIAMNLIVMSLFFIIFSFVNNYINWTKILNTSPNDINEIKKIIGFKPEKIHIYVAPEWKWDVLELAQEIGKPNVGQIMGKSIKMNLKKL